MIRVLAPATSANCCIGFDCMGLALSWYAEFQFTPSDKITVSGCEPEFQTIDNMVVQAFKKTCDYLGKEMPTFHLHEIMDLPFQRGLGSSAACVAGGIAGANAWFKAGLTTHDMLRIANDIEGHPDNVAPALFGGVCVSYVDDTSVQVSELSYKDWKALAMIPSYPISTDEARKALPDTISHMDARKQVAHSLIFVHALEQGDQEVLAKSCHDYLHEPYRAKLIPEYDAIKTYCQKQNMGMWISGSGSTMLAISKDMHAIEQLEEWVHANFQMDCQMVAIAKQGTRVFYE